MITILHGDDITASRNTYHELKQKAQNALTFDGEKLSLTDLTQALQGGGLFGEKQTLFIENFLSKKKESKELKAIASLLSQSANENEITLWEGKELTKKQLETIEPVRARVFKLPQALFSFLESLKPHNGSQMLSLFHQTILTAEIEMVFFMLIRQMRLLLALSDPNSQIEEVKRMAPWQKNKLQQQARAFPTAVLITQYHQIAQLDVEHKTGGNVQPLSSAIDFWLLSF